MSDGIPYAEGWGRILQSERRWRCRVCADHTGAFADISVGDPWHAPPEGDTDAGRSLIVARTPRGRAFVEAAIAAGVLVAEARPRDVIARAQPNLKATNAAVWGRRAAMRMVGLPAPRDVGQGLFRHWLACRCARRCSRSAARGSVSSASVSGVACGSRRARNDARAGLVLGPDGQSRHAAPAARGAVVVSHAWPLALGPGTAEPLSALTGHSLGGWAVALFFFLSGLLRDRERRAPPRARLLGRARRRIVPGLGAALLVTLALALASGAAPGPARPSPGSPVR
jgi:hypothetical protein